ncbi:MAG: 30S ribosome-binding factor RbfA [Candidatus Ratteibacteria bacterium]|jgi:ribosome-binding factor A
MKQEFERERKRLRIASVLQKELWTILRHDFSDERLAFLTITAVKVSKDFRKATITVSPMGSLEEKEAAIAALQESRRHIRQILASRIAIRSIPELEFIPEDGSAARIEEILREIQDERK